MFIILDPQPQISISDYAANRNNPIWLNDPLGDDPTRRAYRYARKHGMNDADFSINTASNGKDAYLDYGIKGGVASKKLVVYQTC